MSESVRSPLLGQVVVLVSETARAYQGTPYSSALDAVVQRLHEPLRVAIAGKIKAGKSTLLNALVGDELAPTDEGECTRIVTR
jgi:predicted GTPase